MIADPVFTLRQINALRACAENPAGLRKAAYPSVMPSLVEIGLVEERTAYHRVRHGQTAWFLTRAGRDLLAKHCQPSVD